MPKKVRIDASSLTHLRDFLAESSLDLGCRPVARKREDRYGVIAIVEDAELDRLTARRAADVRIEVLEQLPPPAARLRMAPAGNRFLRGETPRGPGRKE